MAKKGLSKTAKYYRDNPEARKKKLEYSKKYNAKPSERKKRVKLIQINREADNKGVDRTGKDYDHAVGGYVSSSVNRGRTSGTPGDARARGKKKKTPTVRIKKIKDSK